MRMVRGVVLGGMLALGLGLGAAPATATPNKVLELGFDEGWGAGASDSSGLGNAGTLSDGVRWTQAGRYGRAASFDGDDRVVVPDAPSLDVTTGMTMMAWVRPRVIDRWQTVLMKGNSAAWVPYGMYATGPGGGTPFSITNGAETHAPSPLVKNVWSHVAATYDGTTYRLYVNGAQVATATGGAPAVTQQALEIGNNSIWPTGEGFDGLIDEVRMYDGPLSAAEVLAAKNTRIGEDWQDVARPNLAFSFDEGSGTRANDSGEWTTNRGTITGARWTTAARWGRALNFDGVDDMVTVADANTLDLRDELTISAWIRPRTKQAYQTIVLKEHPTAWRAWSLDATGGLTGGTAKLTGEMGDDVHTDALEGPVLPTGQWSHVAYTFDGATTRLFVNGTQVATGAGTPPPATSEPLLVGGTVKGRAFAGAIDEVRVYDKALPADQIRRDRDTSIIPDAIAAWRNPGDGSAEPQGLGTPTPSAARSADRVPDTGLVGAAVSTSAGAPAARGTAVPAVRAVRSGGKVTVAVTGAAAGRMRVALFAPGLRAAGGCSTVVRATGRASCRATVARRARGRKVLRATITLTPKHGEPRRLTTMIEARGG